MKPVISLSQLLYSRAQAEKQCKEPVICAAVLT